LRTPNPALETLFRVSHGGGRGAAPRLAGRKSPRFFPIQDVARLMLARINVVRQEQCARGRGIKQGTRVGLPRHGINAPFLLELGCSGTRARAVEVSEVSDE